MLDARSSTPIFYSLRSKKISHYALTLRPFFIFSLAVIFLFNSIGGDLLLGESWAAKAAAGLPSVGPADTGSPTPLKELSASTFTIPRELGYIQESIKIPAANKTVIHIQDAHCNYAAQKSIAGILDYLTKEYGIDAVNCEGGYKDYDLSVFTDIPEKDIREKTSDFFVKEGVVSAAEYFAVNNPQKVKLWGMEDADLYVKNLKIYRDSLSSKNEVDRYIKSIGYILDNLKRRIYPEELLEFDAYYNKYKDNKMPFKEYMKYLLSTAQKRLINIKSFSDVYLLSQTLDQEEKIDFKKANNDKDEVVNKLKKVLSRNELEELLTRVAQMKSEKISQSEFYGYLIRKARSINLDMAAYPELQKYIVYISLYNAIDRAKIGQEMDSLENKIKETMYENNTQRELGVLSKNLALTKNMFNISLTKDDYAYYKKYKATFNVSNYVKFIDAKAPLYKIRATLDKNIGALDDYREKMEGFYECSLERDKAFIKNMKFTDHGRSNSIIITGGFHTENLRELFRNEKVSYVSIMPKFKNEPGYESPYMKRLAGQRTPLENVIDTAIPAVLNLQIVQILSKLGVIVEGQENIAKFELAAAIVAALERVKASLTIKIVDKRNNKDEERFVTLTKGVGADAGNIKPSYSDKAAEKIDAVITVLSSEAVEFSLVAPTTQTAQVPAPIDKGVRRILPLNPPEEKSPTFIGSLVSNGTPVTSTAGFVIDFSKKGDRIGLTPPGMTQITVQVARDESQKPITEDPALLASSLSSLAKQSGLLSEDQKEKVLALADRIGAVSSIVAIEDQKIITAFLSGNTFYVSRSALQSPSLLINAMTPSENMKFAQNMGRLTANWRGSVYNVFVMEASPETIAAQTAIGRETSGAFEKIFGINTVVLYYTDSKSREKQLERLKQLMKENEEKYPMAFINCMNGEDLAAATDFVDKNPSLSDIVAIGKDFREGAKEIHVPDEVKIIVVGSTMMNDRRLSINFKMTPQDLYESRMETLSILNAVGVIDNADFDIVKNLTVAEADELNKFMQKIWRGAISLHCTKVDWEKLEDWKNAQRQLLQSV